MKKYSIYLPEPIKMSEEELIEYYRNNPEFLQKSTEELKKTTKELLSLVINTMKSIEYKEKFLNSSRFKEEVLETFQNNVVPALESAKNVDSRFFTEDVLASYRNLTSLAASNLKNIKHLGLSEMKETKSILKESLDLIYEEEEVEKLETTYTSSLKNQKIEFILSSTISYLASILDSIISKNFGINFEGTLLIVILIAFINILIEDDESKN